MHHYTFITINALAVLLSAEAKALGLNEPSFDGFVTSYDACSNDSRLDSNTCTGPWVFDYQDNCKMEKSQCGEKPCQKHDWVIRRDQASSPRTASSGEYNQAHVGYGKSRHKDKAWTYAWNNASPKMAGFIDTCIANARAQIPRSTEGKMYEEVRGSLRLEDAHGHVYNVGAGDGYHHVFFTWYDHHHQNKKFWPDVHKIWMHARCTAQVQYIEIPKRYECVTPGIGYQSCEARWQECPTLRDASYPGMTYSEAKDVGDNTKPSADGGIDGIFNQSCSTCNMWPMSAQYRLDCLAEQQTKVDEVTETRSVQLVEADRAISRAVQLVIEQSGVQTAEQRYNLETPVQCGYYYDEHNERIPSCIYEQLPTQTDREMLEICVRLTNEHVSTDLVEAYIDGCMDTLDAFYDAAQSAESSCAGDEELSAVDELVSATNEALLAKLGNFGF